MQKKFQTLGLMRMRELFFRQNLIKERRNKMAGLTQQDQKQNSPFTLEAVLEEESEEELRKLKTEEGK